MTPRRRAFSRLLTIFAVWSIAASASAQLLAPLPPLKTLDPSCTPSILSSSPKLDAAVQRWARLGAPGSARIIVSAQNGLVVGTLKTLLGALDLPLLGDLVRINAVAVEVNGHALPAVACSAAVASISIDATVTPSWYDGFAQPDVVAPGHGLVSAGAGTADDPASTVWGNLADAPTP